MSFEETLAAIAAGGAFTLASSIVAQYYLLRRQETEDSKERVYSPLYDEITVALEELDNHGSAQTREWDRISKEEHLTYRIRDSSLQRDLRQFYGQTLCLCNMKKNTLTNFYPGLVIADLNQRLENRATQTTIPDVMAVSQAVGWNLERDSIPAHILPSASQCYKNLTKLSSGFEKDNLVEYFLWWKDNVKPQTQMKEYVQARRQAILEATLLKERLGKRLEVKNQDRATLGSSQS